VVNLYRDDKKGAVLKMDWNKTYRRIQRLAGKELESITGRTDIVLESIDPEFYYVQWGKKLEKKKRRKTLELREVVAEMALNRPVHVDSAVRGNDSSRSHPETVLANLPDVEWVYVKANKHIVWVGKDTHRPGTLKGKI
jgi:hypothetical protein